MFHPFLILAKSGAYVKKRQPKWYFDALRIAKTPQERSTLRSKTFMGIAKAMSSQWTIDPNQLELF